MKYVMIIALAGLLLGGCAPGKRSTRGDKPAPEGTWAARKFLVRSYPDLSMQKAIKAATQTAESLGWEEDDDDYGRHKTSLEYEAQDGTEIIIRIWVPADGSPTDVGIRYDDKKRIVAAPEFLDKYEQVAGVQRVN